MIGQDVQDGFELALAILRAERDSARADLRDAEAKSTNLMLALQQLVDEYEGFRSAHGWLPGNPATRNARAALLATLPDIVLDAPFDPPEES